MEKDCCSYSAVAAQGLDDMINLDVLHSASILHNLHTRFDADKIYTYVGSILLSVNPFKPISIFGDDQIDTYAKADVMAIKDGTLKPHIFAVAKDSFEQMLRDQKSQSVIISGESGAGKTEATKYVLKYLTAVSSKAGKKGAAAGAELSPVEKMIIQSSPILEAFGNAKTVRNNNSSRFGKYFEIQFSSVGEITGGVITDYLLEKSRVVCPAENERGYHIFYLLCKGASPEERAKYKIENLTDFHYTNLSGCFDVEGVDEVEEYKAVQQAFADCKMTNLEVDAVKRILAGILHLGNAKFESAEDDDPCNLSADSAASIKAVADLMDFSESQLSNSLTQRTMSTGGRGSVYKIKLKKKEAEAARDALAKHMYLTLFSWIVKKVSDNMQAEKPPAFSIGVLDIFGFEVMPVNSFEQLCINFANEKLHQQFIHYVFALEMEEYDKEKLGITIDYEDNKDCVELIEKKGTGILGILQEQCQLGARGSDAEFLNNTIQTYNKHKYFIVEKRSRTEFSISHYANPVKYETEGFLEKNRDSVNDDIRSLMDSTSMPEIKSIIHKKEDAAAGAAAGARGRKRKVATVANKFKDSLQTLVTVINSTTPHYVRCLKSTEKKMPGIFDGANMNRQLGYSGVLETIKVRLAGYAVRMDYSVFVRRFAILVGKVEGEGKAAASEILTKSKIDVADTKVVALGITKVFLKREALLLQLEKAREQFLLSSVLVIQRYWRREYARRKFQKLKEEAKRKAEEEARRREEEERKKKEEAEAAARLQQCDQQETAGEDEGRERSATEQNNALKSVMSKARTDGAQCTFLNIKDRVMVLGYTPMATNHRNKVDKESPGISMEPVMIKGWLAKEGSKGFTTGRFNNWNKRFFVMKKDRIVYYKDESLKDKKGDFQLETSSSVTEIPETYHKNLPTGVGNHFFQVNIRGRSTKLACDHETEKEKWMDGISTAILQLKSGSEKVKTGSDFSVHMPDRSILTSSVKTSNAKDVFLKVATTVSIQKGIQFFSLVKAYTTPDRLDFYNVFSERDNVADLGPYRLAFYRVISLKGKDDLSDPKLLMVEYSQTVRANLMFFEYEEKDAIELAALQLKVKEGTISSVTHTRGFLSENLHEYMPDSQLMRYGDNTEVTNQWEADILNRAADIESSKKSVNECMEEYIKKSQENVLYGCTFFEVSMIREEQDYAYILGVNSTGLHVIDRKTRALVVSFPYVSIMRWSRSSKKFNFTTQGENHWTMLTKQGEEINKFMGIYVRFLLDNKD